MKFPSYLKVALLTTLNIALNAVKLGRFVWLEGRVRGDVFMNWARHFRYRPREFVRPTTEAEIVELVRHSRRVRVFGSGHSFNSGIVSDDTLVSLNDYSGLVWKGPDKKQIAVKGGTRVRDVVELLFEEGLAFDALPSHDAQSIAGILSTDVHGTGENWGFVSQSVVRLKLIDGRGEIHECEPSDDLFKAAIGGIGAVGYSGGGDKGRRALQRRTEGRNGERLLRREEPRPALAEIRSLQPLPLPLFGDVPDQHVEPHAEEAFVPRRFQGVHKHLHRRPDGRVGREFRRVRGVVTRLFVPRLRCQAGVASRAGEQQSLQPHDLPPAPGARVHGPVRGHLQSVQAVHQALPGYVPSGVALRDLRGPIYAGKTRPDPGRCRPGSPVHVDRPRVQRFGWLQIGRA